MAYVTLFYFAIIYYFTLHWWKLLIFALGFTVLIETSQLVIDLYLNNMYRNVDIDDIILNGLGAYIGYGIYKIIPKKIKETCLNFDK